MRPEGGSIWRSASKVASATFLSRILGLIREQVFAYLFGAGLVTDAFQIAFRIPNLLRDLFAEGAMSSALVPVYTRVRMERGEDQAWRLVNNAICCLAIVTGLIALLGMWQADTLVRIYAPAFAQNLEKFTLATELTRWLWPFFPLVVLAALSMGVLNARHSFGVPALAPTMFNIASIAAAFLLCPIMERFFGLPAIFGMALGALLGGAWQFLFQVPALLCEGFAFRFVMAWRDPDLRKIFTLMAVGTFGLAATQINILINSIFASSMGDGAVSWLGYAFRLMQFPIGVFGVAISTVTLTKVSAEVLASDLSIVSRTIAKSIRMVFVLTIPSAVGLAVLGVPIISVIYEHGRFTMADTNSTARALAFYAIGLTAYSGVRVLVPVFYSLNKAILPIFSSLLAVLVNYALCHLLSQHIGFAGLALATSCSAIANFAILALLLGRILPDFSLRLVGINFFQVCVASGAMALVLWCAKMAIGSLWLASSFGIHLIILLFGLVLGIAVYWGCARVIGLKEADELWAAISRRLAR